MNKKNTFFQKFSNFYSFLKISYVCIGITLYVIFQDILIVTLWTPENYVAIPLFPNMAYGTD